MVIVFPTLGLYVINALDSGYWDKEAHAFSRQVSTVNSGLIVGGRLDFLLIFWVEYLPWLFLNN